LLIDLNGILNFNTFSVVSSIINENANNVLFHWLMSEFFIISGVDHEQPALPGGPPGVNAMQLFSLSLMVQQNKIESLDTTAIHIKTLLITIVKNTFGCTILLFSVPMLMTRHKVKY
jgi:hypothetical protein